MATTEQAVETHAMYIGGEWMPAAGGETFEEHNPATGEPIGRFAAGGPDDADRAVAAAKRAHDERRWRGLTGAEKQARLRAVADWIRAEHDRLVQLVAVEAGKPLPFAEFDVIFAADFFDYYSGVVRDIGGRTMANLRPDLSVSTVKEPAGVAAVMTPWNFPLLIAAQKAAPALASGCTVVLKPAPQTPLTALELARAAEAADIPPGVFNVLTDVGPGSPVGERLCAHPDVSVISFTGSDATGARVMASAAPTLKKVILECGGKSPMLVHHDANLEEAVDAAVFGIFFNTGQVCNGMTRLFVHDAIADEFFAAFREKADALRIGDPLDPETQVGPLISADQLARVLEYVRVGREEGADLVFGGERLTGERYDRGHFMAPTLFEGVDQRMRISQEEIFGPVLAASRYSDLDEAIAQANDTPFGLAAAIWSQDVDTVERAVRDLDAGIVWVNDFLAMFPEAPHGGYGMSGIGREMGPEAVAEYFENKTVMRKFGPRQMMFS